MADKWLICGSRLKGKETLKAYRELVFKILNETYWNKRMMMSRDEAENYKPEIIEGCCSRSADEFAEEWAKVNDYPLPHFPAVKGGYLKRNVTMINQNPSRVIAFWNGHSLGTAHTIALATLKGIPVKIIMIDKLSR